MPEIEPLVLSYSHLAGFPRAGEALHTLKKVASLVKPIMRARGWKVGELAEFFPDQPNLLGLNVNRGQKILLRLRHPGDRSQFVPIEQVVDTMLHELSHIVHGPHDAKFHALWNQLRDEHEGLTMKGYTGEGFLSEGHRLGGRSVPTHEARRLARAAAEKRKALGANSGRRLGGAAPRPGEDIRGVIVGAIERRRQVERGCGNDNDTMTERDIQKISDEAARDGTRAKAEEDAANDAAIAQALWELVQEDEREKYGEGYVPPSQENPWGSGGYGGATASGGPGGGSSSSSSAPPVPQSTRPPPVPTATKPAKRESPPPEQKGWTCDICTLHNPANFLMCDACGTERPETVTRDLAAQAASKRIKTAPPKQQAVKKTATSGASRNDTTVAASTSSGTTPAPVQTWVCSFCGTCMDRQWWTCSTCGLMKDSSR